MQGKKINSFSIYAEYIDLIELLSTEEEQAELIWKICKYMFFDEIPVLNDKQSRIFNNLKRPLDKSKNKSNKGQSKIELESNQNQNETKKETHQDVYVNVNDLENKKDNRGMGKEEKEETFVEKREKIHFAEFVSMTNAQYEKLVSTHGKKFADQCIETLDNYKGSKGKIYKDDYRAILSWVVDLVREKNQGRFKKGESLPEWFNQDLENEKMTAEEQKELNDLLNSMSGGQSG